MKFKSILRGVAAVAGTLNPGVGAAIALINNFLPDNKRLPETATGAQAMGAYETLTDSAKAKVDAGAAEFEHLLGMEQEYTSQWVAMNQADQSGSATRPKVVLMFAYLIFMVSAAFITYLFVALINEGTEGVKAVADLWPLLAAATSVPSTVILSYFNHRGKEKRTRYAVMNGHAPNTIGGIVSMFMRAAKQ